MVLRFFGQKLDFGGIQEYNILKPLQSYPYRGTYVCMYGFLFM